MMRQRKGSNIRKQGRIKSKEAVTVIQAVTAMLITRKATFKTTTKVKAYYLLSSVSHLSLTSLL